MANLTYERGACTPPFLQMSQFPISDGYLPGRFCAPVPSIEGTIDCCLPCPLTDWVYSDRFRSIPEVTNWLNVAGLACCLSLLISYFVLPVEKTSRHYLTVGFVVAVCILQLGFIIPLGARPDQCHDSITPNNMYSDLSCALSGAFLLAGGFAAIMWGFLRSLSLHLQICWKVIPGRKFFWASVLAGCGVPIIFAATAYALTGVSNRFGSTCLLNHENALQDFWGPLLAFAAVSTVLQFATFGYCIKVYIMSLLDDSTSTDNTSTLPSYNSSVKTITAKQAYRRVRKVVALQWRGILIVLIIIVNVAFLSIIFVSMDNTIQTVKKDIHKAEPWLLCLVVHAGDKNKCLDQVGSLVKNEGTMIAALMLLSLNGFWTLLLLGRISLFPAWGTFLRRKFAHKHDFVSVDARRFSADPRNYEMIQSPPQTAYKSSEPHLMSSPADRDSTATFSPSSKSDYFGKEATYASPVLSFSTPIPPSAGVPQQGREWNPESTHAKGSRSNTSGDG